MRVSEVLSGSVETFLTLTPQIQDHLEGKENPHHVTKEQVGLGNVKDEKQATEEEFLHHTSSPVLNHPDGAVTTEKLRNGAVTAEKLAPGAVDGKAIKNGEIGAEHFSDVLKSTVEGKVDKEEGMGLSQNSFTDAEKAKLGAIAIKDGADLTVDTATLMLKTMPLKVRKTKTELIKTGEISRAQYNWFKELYKAAEDPETGGIVIFGKDKWDLYGTYSVHPDGTEKTSVGVETSERHCVFDGTEYFAQLRGFDFLIHQYNGNPFSWKMFRVEGGENTRLQDFFVLEDRIVVVYISDRDGGKFHVESFNYNQEREWKFSVSSTSYQQVGDTQIYDQRFRRAVMDGDDLYIAPVRCEENPYGLLRLNRNGEITGRYMPVTDFSAGDAVLVEFSKYGDRIYGITIDKTLVRISPATEAVDKAKIEGTGTRLCNLLVVRGEKVFIHTEDTDEGVTYICRIDGKNMKPGKDLFPEKEAEAIVGETYACSCYTQNGFELFQCLPSEIKSHVYNTADIYTVL